MRSLGAEAGNIVRQERGMANYCFGWEVKRQHASFCDFPLLLASVSVILLPTIRTFAIRTSAFTGDKRTLLCPLDRRIPT